jgi:PleD family two-component response regulator
MITTETLTRSRDSGPAGRARSVLVAEESDATREFLAANLTADGYRVRTAGSREKALAVLTVEAVDVIVVDELVIDTLDQLAQPVTLTALQAQLRRSGERVGELARPARAARAARPRREDEPVRRDRLGYVAR